MNVGVIGLGMMGSQIAKSQKVEKLHATNTTNLKLANLPKEVGNSSDMVIICVKDYQAIANVSFATGGLIETTNTDLIVVQCSTDFS